MKVRWYGPSGLGAYSQVSAVASTMLKYMSPPLVVTLKSAAEPARKAAAAETGRKARASKYDAEYEQFKARRAAAQKQAAAQAEAEPAPVAAPVVKPAPAPAPAPAAPAVEPKPFSVSSDSEFSLDDILAEFK